jgi:Spy/CpxP family protein refolding chaperone
MKRAMAIGITTGVLLLAAGGTFAVAANRKGGAWGAKGRLAALDSVGAEPFVLERIAAKLDLTKEQRQEIRGILAAKWDEGLEKAVDDSRIAHREMRHAIQDPRIGEADVRVAARKAAATDEELAVWRARTVREVLEVLTPEQKEKAQALRAELESVGDSILARVDRFLGRG